MADALVLAHGAGSNRNAPVLVAVDRAFTASGFEVVRIDLPFRIARPSGPPRPGDAERDREGLRKAVSEARGRADSRVYLGGHSYGGRQATMLASEDPTVADGLLLFSYPLHPPSRPEQRRTAHLPNLRTPSFFVHGTRDPFGSIAEIDSLMDIIPARIAVMPVERAGHDLRPLIKDAARVVKEFLRFFE